MASGAEKFSQHENVVEQERKKTPLFTVDAKGEQLLSRWLRANYAIGIDLDRTPPPVETIDLGYYKFSQNDRILEEVDAFLVASPTEFSYGINLALFPRILPRNILKEERSLNQQPVPEILMTKASDFVQPVSFEDLQNTFDKILPKEKYTSILDSKEKGIKFEIKDKDAGIKDAFLIYDKSVLSMTKPTYIFSLSQDLHKDADKFPNAYKLFSEMAPLVIESLYRSQNAEPVQDTFVVEPRRLPRIEAFVQKFESLYKINQLESSAPKNEQAVSEHLLKPNPELSFKDVVGNKKVKTKIREITNYIAEPSVYKKTGDIEPATGIIIAGEKGTGKTMMLEALASETDRNVYLIKGSDVINTWGMHAEKEITEIFKAARKHAPSVVAFDGIDLLRAENPTAVTMIRTIVGQIDGARKNGEYVPFIATARESNHINPSFFNSSRCDGEIVHTSLPFSQERAEILEKKITRYQEKALQNGGACIFDSMDYEKLGAASEGLTGADLDNLVKKLLRQKASHAVKNPDDTSSITMKDIEQEIRVAETKKRQLHHGKYTYL